MRIKRNNDDTNYVITGKPGATRTCIRYTISKLCNFKGGSSQQRSRHGRNCHANDEYEMLFQPIAYYLTRCEDNTSLFDDVMEQNTFLKCVQSALVRDYERAASDTVGSKTRGKKQIKIIQSRVIIGWLMHKFPLPIHLCDSQNPLNFLRVFHCADRNETVVRAPFWQIKAVSRLIEEVRPFTSFPAKWQQQQKMMVRKLSVEKLLNNNRNMPCLEAGIGIQRGDERSFPYESTKRKYPEIAKESGGSIPVKKRKLSDDEDDECVELSSEEWEKSVEKNKSLKNPADLFA